ncbi:hypothetical protein [Streptococcus macacae]|uniref:Uncharacterized protein n=1 Tax=Streptococcus macacae NCTC 11558 TaxID=764298 RepID=G5JXN3_9STRE|nr:hypothetical protein [Streptococcus macacae]EHJ53200.1 hypothetical protein STRMA_1657 [Streptococcus macacae NCTC 11558]SUN77590.1 Uncharacterised protein [Streptococcus macacae NCTC 11558]
MKLDIRASDHSKNKDFHYEFAISDKILLGLVAVSFGAAAVIAVSKNWKSQRKKWWQ